MAIIVIGLGIILAVFLSIKNRDAGFLVIFPVSAFVAFFVGIAIDGPVSWVTRDKVDVSYELAELNDGNSVDGSFFLGSGVVNSRPSFTFYLKQDDGSYVLRSWRAGSSSVVESEATPHAVYHCHDYSSVPRPFRWTDKMVIDAGSDWVDCSHASVTFYVPNGSVKNNYVLNTQ